MRTKSSHSIFFSLIVLTFFFPHLIASDPQTNLIKLGCSQYNTTSPSSFFSDLNATFSNIRSQLISATFVTAQSNQIYTLFQCRPYLSTSDCLSCFSAAERQIRNCSARNGARVVYDGCYLRYESEDFFNQTTLAGNVLQCGGNLMASEKEFGAVVDGLLTDLCKAAPRIVGLSAAGKRAVGVGGEVVYGVAQCVETVGRSGCEACLRVAYKNVKACQPDVDGRAFDAGCFLRYSDTAFFGDNQTTDLAPFLQTNTGGSSNKKAIIAGISGGSAFVLLILIIILLGRLKKIRSTGERDTFGATELRGPKNYHYNDLKFATRNFNEKCKLGKGGFGDVYKGVLKNGNTVAVKKLMISQSLVVREHFEREVKLISNVNHRNLVRLLGCCNKGPELLLVYEYMANSSLDKFLFGDKHRILNWKERFDIIVGTARDFGLVRLLPEDQSHLNTRFAGTLGYTAPEYAINGQLSEKVDTYSYGVVVLEIISGRKCSHIKTEPVTQYLLEWAWRLYEEDLLMELLDESLNPNEYSADEVKKAIQVALMCLQSPASRPTMSEVVVLLLSRGGLGIRLNRPTFIDATNNRTFTRVHNVARTDTSTSAASSASNATVTISQLSAR
ncbi:hypothetical protein AAC387_Pa04g2210 [Persea americana]